MASGGAHEEKLMFLPLNLVFRLAALDPVRAKQQLTELDIQRTLQLDPEVKEFSYFRKTQRFDLSGIIVRNAKGACKAYALMNQTWKQFVGGRLVNCVAEPCYSEQEQVYMLLYRLQKIRKEL